MSEVKKETKSRPPRTKKRRWSFRRVLLTIGILCAVGIVAMATIPIPRWADGSGYVMTDDEAEIRPSVEGAIDRWLVRSGDLVKKDQLLVQLKDSVQQAALAQARNELTTIQARLEHLRCTQTLTKSQRREQIFRAKRSLAMAKEELEKKRKIPGAVSQQELAEAKWKVELATSNLTELQLPRQKVMAGRINVLKEQIDAAKKKVVLHAAMVELRKIRSPLNGTIYFNNFEPGEVVKPEHVLGQVFDHSCWIVKLKISEHDIAHVKPGQSVEVELAAYPSLRYGEMAATVTRVLPVVTPQATGDGIFYVEARVDQPADWKLNVGMTARGSINTGSTTYLLRILGW
ncbi:MAG: HlyD family efflux transporter periplasmic adaptor subunit [Phycisphaerae bacterium]|nr:HlyD family efflux transporter periplasmic adaptor subunit [Phycisphaerae bacterium]